MCSDINYGGRLAILDPFSIKPTVDFPKYAYKDEIFTNLAEWLRNLIKKNYSFIHYSYFPKISWDQENIDIANVSWLISGTN